MRDTTTATHSMASTLRPVILVVPCYNEAERLSGQTFLDHVAEHPGTGFLFVDDGSTDATAERLTELVRRNPAALEMLQLDRNRGKAEAVRQGVNRAITGGATFVGYWDADLSTPLEEAEEFAALLADSPQRIAVIGSRVRRLGARVERRAMRHYAGRIFATCASLVLGLAVYDTQCGAKLFRVCDEVKRAFAEPFLSRWIFDVEVLARLTAHHREGNEERTLYEKPLACWHDVPGSKLRLRHAIGAIGELAMIHRARRGARSRR